MKRLDISLGKVQETLLLPLWARALEMSEPYPIIRDHMAADLVAQVNYDFDRLERTYAKHRVAFPIRARVFDLAITYFLKQNPEAVVINLAAGLDTTFFRVDNGKLDWYDLDLPDSMELRQQLIPERERVTQITGSMLETDWLDKIDDRGRPVMIMAAGILFYLPPKEVASMMQAIHRRFPNAELLFDLYTYISRRYRKLGARWGVYTDRFIRDWQVPMKIVSDLRYIDIAPDRWPKLVQRVRWFTLSKLIVPRLIHARFGRE